MQTVGLVVRVLCVFALLGATIWVLSRLDGRAGKKGFGKNKRERAVQVKVTASARLSKGASVSVVRVGDTDFVLGVTDGNVNLLQTRPVVERAPAVIDQPVEQPAATSDRPDFAALLKARLGRTPAQASSAAPADTRTAPQTPPTAAEFLGNSWRVARGRTLASTDVSDVAVQAALAALAAIAPAAVTADAPTPIVPTTRTPLSPVDGSTGLRTSTDARPAQEHLWSPPASTTPHSDGAFARA
jgi:flagellar biogenesis protein FliO